MIDEWRARDVQMIKDRSQNNTIPMPPSAVRKQQRKVDFEGHGTLIVAKDTVNATVPLCLAIPSSGNKISLLPCFEEWVPPTLAMEWETGAVVLSETIPHTRWEVGPCTSDGEITRL